MYIYIYIWNMILFSKINCCLGFPLPPPPFCCLEVQRLRAVPPLEWWPGKMKWWYPYSSSISIGFVILNHLFWGTPIDGNRHIIWVPEMLDFPPQLAKKWKFFFQTKPQLQVIVKGGRAAVVMWLWVKWSTLMNMDETQGNSYSINNGIVINGWP